MGRNNMEKCTVCKIKYPSEILSPAFGLETKGVICGICALQLSNELHGDNRIEFNGETAEDFRLEAIEWRKKHEN